MLILILSCKKKISQLRAHSYVLQMIIAEKNIIKSDDMVSLTDLMSKVCSVEKGTPLENVLTLFKDSQFNFQN